MRMLYLVSWPKPNGGTEHRTTPHLPSKTAAFIWIVQLKPYLLRQPEAVAIRPWRRGDPR